MNANKIEGLTEGEISSASGGGMSQYEIIRQAFADLGSGDRFARLQAVHALGQHKVQDAISQLVELLQDDDYGAAAAEALGAIGTAHLSDTVEIYDQPDFNARPMGAVREDETVTVLRFSDDRKWVYVHTLSSVEGWLWAAVLSSPKRRVGAKPPQTEEDRGPSRSIPADLLDDLLKEEEKSAVLPRPIAPPSAIAPQAAEQAIQFSAYYPKEVVPNLWLSLRAYMYRMFAAPQVLDDVRQQLGDDLSDYRHGSDAARADIQSGTLVTATPELPGFQFNPPTLSLLFVEDWHRFDFKLRSATAPAEQAANGRITFTVEGIIVADIPMSIFVSPSATSASPTGSSSPALPAAMANATAKLYQAVFCSYSHKDTQIVERVERAYKALGLDYLRDITTLKSGQNWNAELLNMIDRADIFQLFWSSSSAQSKYVRQEWEHAVRRAAGREAFIRPVFWEQPMPAVPQELSAIHFAYQPELDD
jgi:hypothetical protein